MRIVVYSTKAWVRDAFDRSNERYGFDVQYLDTRLDATTAPLADGAEAVCVFVNDTADKETLRVLAESGVKMVALRSAGFNNVDLHAAREYGLTVARVPAYSPYAVAEHTVALILALNRRLYRAYNRVREGNFALDGLLGFDVHGKTVGVIGTGKIGEIFARIISGFGVTLLGYDRFPRDELRELGMEYVGLEELYRRSDIVSLHCPLNHETYHLINDYAINSLKRGAMVVNTSRGPLIDSTAVIDGLKEGKIGSVALDVYEEEADLFFEDLSDQVIQDDTFVRLLTFPNVLITAHQAFFTAEAVTNISDTTFENLAEFAEKNACRNCIDVEHAYGG